jgi:hypothetical protein
MESIRKISLLAVMVVAAITVAAPAGASAAKMEIPAGKIAPVGAQLTMTSINPTFNTTWGLQKCAEITLPGELIQNNGTVKVRGGVGSSKYCVSGTSPFTLEPELRGLTLNSPQSGTMDLRLSIKYSWGGTCVLERSDIPVSYSAGSSEFQVANAAMKGKPAACEPFVLNAKFKLGSVFIPGTPVLT